MDLRWIPLEAILPGSCLLERYVSSDLFRFIADFVRYSLPSLYL